MRRLLALAVVGLALAGTPAESQAAPIELLTNGNFETGTFAGWTVTNLAGSFPGSNWFIDVPGTTSPVSGFATAPNPLGGGFYAVTDQGGPGTHALRQSFTVPAGSSSVILSFQMFVNNQNAATIIGAQGLNHVGAPNQHARVDILTAGAGPFDTGPTVLGNFFLGADAGPNPHGYTNYSFNITSLVGAGGTFQLRFAEVDNQFFFQQGVDNVSILAESGVVPEPATLAVFGALAAGALGLRRRVRRA